MSLATDCSCACSTPIIENIPGVAGAQGLPGTNGVNGQNSYSTTTIALDVPAAAGPVISPAVVTFVSSAWMSIGQVIFISDGVDWGHFRVVTLPSSTSATLTWLAYPGDAAAGSNIATSATVSAAGVFALPAPLPTALTNSTTGVAGATLAVGTGYQTLSFGHTFIGGTAAVEPVTTLVLGYAFKIISWSFVTEVLLVGAAGSRVANMEIGATDVGTVPSTITIPIASATVGTVVSGTAVAGANTGSATDAISIEIAAGGTQFTAGSGSFKIVVANMDLANSVASLNTSINTLITALT